MRTRSERRRRSWARCARGCSNNRERGAGDWRSGRRRRCHHCAERGSFSRCRANVSGAELCV